MLPRDTRFTGYWLQKETIPSADYTDYTDGLKQIPAPEVLKLNRHEAFTF
jgi:hypothetical protein